LAAFDKIKFLMPIKDIETFLGKGTPVEASEVFDAVGSTPDTTGQPDEYISRGLWVRWKGRDRNIFVQFAEESQACLALCVTEKDWKVQAGARTIEIDWKYGAQRFALQRTLIASPFGIWIPRVDPPAENPRVTLAAFKKIEFLMPMKDI